MPKISGAFLAKMAKTGTFAAGKPPEFPVNFCQPWGDYRGGDNIPGNKTLTVRVKYPAGEIAGNFHGLRHDLRRADLDRRPGRRAGKIRLVSSGVFRGAFRGGGAAPAGRTDKRPAPKNTGGRPAGKPAGGRTGGQRQRGNSLQPPAPMEAAKAGRQGDGQPRRGEFYAPGAVSR